MLLLRVTHPHRRGHKTAHAHLCELCEAPRCLWFRGVSLNIFVATPTHAALNMHIHCNQFDPQTVKTESTKSVSKRQQGRYECIFVERPRKHLQTECSVCLCILREPCLVDCCGNRFCQICIEPI